MGGIKIDCSPYICLIIRSISDMMEIRGRKSFVIIGFILLLVAACSNVDSDLDNKWQLRHYQYPDGRVEKQDSIFYNFQKGSFSAICLLRNGTYCTFFGNYSLIGAKISIILLPESVDDPNYASYMGWENGERTFDLEELSSTTLRLQYEDVRYVFRKY